MSSLVSKYKDHFITFVEAGFIAINQMDEPTAQRLFKAAKLLNPESTFPDLGLGFLHLCKLEIKQAMQFFNTVLKKDPENETALSFLAVAEVFSTDKESTGYDHLKKLKESEDESIKKFSKDSLEFVEKFLKKSMHK